MSYPIHITNIYELLNEDGEPTSTRVNAPSSATKDTKQVPRSTMVGTAKTTGQTSSSTRGAPTKTGNSSRGGERGSLGERINTDRPQNSRGRGQSDRPPRQQGDRPPRQQGGFVVSEDRNNSGFVERKERERDGESRGERKSRGAPAGGFVGNRRVFDRKSGTGRGRDYKKGGAGRGNWGRDGEGSEQIIAEDQAALEEGKETVKEEKPEEPEKEKVETEEEKLEREEREKEEKTMTLEQYMKSRENKAPVVALPTERKANEGVDQNEIKKWGNYQEIKRDDIQEQSKAEAKDKKKNVKELVPTFFTVKDNQPRRDRDERPRGERRGGNGNRGSGSSRGGRGGNRGGRGGKSGDIPQFDESSFPTLATK